MKERENLDNRIFVGGLSREVTERQLEDAFERYGKIIECQIMMGKDTGHSRGFGFITFTDRRGADDAIRHMHGMELGDRIIAVNKAEPKLGGDDVDHFRKGGGYSSRGGGGGAPVAEDACFKCGRPGHWARDCPSAGGNRGRSRSPLPMRSRIRDFDGHRDRYGDRELEQERDYMDGRRDSGRYSYRDRYSFEDGDKYDHYPMERYAQPGERYGMMPEHHHPEEDYNGRERGYDRDDRYKNDRYMRPLHDEGRAYRSRPGPYDRPSRTGGRSSSYDRW